MHTNNDIPSRIFDLIESLGFEQLSQNDKDFVLSCITEAEYTELFSSVQGIRLNVLRMENKPKERIKKNLLKSFDAHHAQNSGGIRFLLGWKIAASIVLLALISVSVVYTNKHLKSNEITFLPKIDTVYIVETKSMDLPHSFDTVYIERKVKEGSDRGSSLESNLAKNVVQIPHSDDHILRPENLKELPNLQKGNSLKDDELVAAIGMVTF